MIRSLAAEQSRQSSWYAISQELPVALHGIAVADRAVDPVMANNSGARRACQGRAAVSVSERSLDAPKRSRKIGTGATAKRTRPSVMAMPEIGDDDLALPSGRTEATQEQNWCLFRVQIRARFWR
jgi:hypothetical protein